MTQNCNTDSVVVFNKCLVRLIDEFAHLAPFYYRPVLATITDAVTDNIAVDTYIMQFKYIIDDVGGYTAFENLLKIEDMDELLSKIPPIKIQLMGLTVDVVEILNSDEVQKAASPLAQKLAIAGLTLMVLKTREWMHE